MTHCPRGECFPQAQDSAGSSNLNGEYWIGIIFHAIHFSSMSTDASPTFETARAEFAEVVFVHLELLQRRRQCRDAGELVAVKVQLLQKGQVLEDTPRKEG